MRRNRSIFAAFIFLIIAAPVAAQGYPSKPIRMLMTSPTGGPPDVMFRGLLGELRESIGQPIVVENMPGADEMIAAQALVRSASDGYTLMVSTAIPIVLIPLIRSNVSYDSQRDLAPVAMIAKFQSAFVVNTAVPARTLKQFLALAKAKPGFYTMGSGGAASPSNIYAEWFRHQLKIDLFNVGYKTIPAALQGVMAGEVHATAFAMGAQAAALEKAGKIRIIAMLTERRVASHPDVPTMAEEGIDLLVLNWLGLFAPARTPAEIVVRWNSAIAKAIANPTYSEKYFTSQGFDRSAPSGEPPEAFARFIARDRVLNQRIQREAKLQVQ